MAKKKKEILPTPQEALQKYWGYDSFRENQREIIDSIIAGRDTLALLPTGGGKSLTFQIPALAMEGVCIVVTPLIALMKDQVDRLKELKIPAVAIHSGLSMQQIDKAMDNCIYGDYKIMYVAPERITSVLFRHNLSLIKVSFIAVDEAHCISQWGYDFRPSYLKIGRIREEIENIPILAVTASATKIVRDDIIRHLRLNNCNTIQGDFSRKNLSYVVRTTEDKTGQLLRILNHVEGSTIIYVRTRRGCEKWTKFLQDNGHSAIFYHGGLPNMERSLRQDEWVTGEYRIIVATNAFGMGIDKPDVRLVVHLYPCDSIEAYYQEAGRAGRDGKRSYAVLLTSAEDNQILAKCIENEFPDIESVKTLYDKICASLFVAYGEGENNTYNFSLREFCAKEKIFSGRAAIMLKLLDNNGYITFSDEVKVPARIIFAVKRDELYRIRITNNHLDHIIRILLRLYEGIFTEFREINEIKIAKASGYTIPQVKELLKELWQMRIIRYTPSDFSSLITLNTPRIPIKHLYISPKSYLYRKKLYIDRLNSMLAYAKNNTKCRAFIMELYFGIDNPKECGTCDICIEKRRQKSNTNEGEIIEAKIIETLQQYGTITVKELAMKLPFERKHIAPRLEKLINEERVIFSRDSITLDKK